MTDLETRMARQRAHREELIGLYAELDAIELQRRDVKKRISDLHEQIYRAYRLEIPKED